MFVRINRNLVINSKCIEFAKYDGKYCHIMLRTWAENDDAVRAFVDGGLKMTQSQFDDIVLQLNGAK